MIVAVPIEHCVSRLVSGNVNERERLAHALCPLRASAAGFTMQLRTGRIDGQCSATECLTVNGCYSFFRGSVIRHLDERNTCGLIRLSIRHDLDSLDNSELHEEAANSFLGNIECQITRQNVIHTYPLFVLSISSECSSHSTGWQRICDFRSRIAAHLIASESLSRRSVLSGKSHPGTDGERLAPKLGRSARGGKCRLQYSRFYSCP